jgi:DNA uptake protein ComE-like DNA-binding protein
MMHVIKSTFLRQFSQAHLVLLGLVFCLVAGCSNTPEAAKPDTSSASPASTPVNAEPKAAKSSKIDINTAPIAELDKLELPGTKPSLSERIQAGRPYKQNDDLVTKKVISAEEFKLIQNLVTTEAKK